LIETKLCLKCDKPLIRRHSESTTNFRNRRYCNISCSKSGKNNAMYGVRIIGERHWAWNKTRPDVSENNRKYRGEKARYWVGDNIRSMSALHDWLRRNWPGGLPTKCQTGGCDKPMFDLANIRPDVNHDTYNRDFSNWICLCRYHHMETDGRLARVKRRHRNKQEEE
jgi:hypothetical protein